jgi:hypothetical protein
MPELQGRHSRREQVLHRMRGIAAGRVPLVRHWQSTACEVLRELRQQSDDGSVCRTGRGGITVIVTGPRAGSILSRAATAHRDVL